MDKNNNSNFPNQLSIKKEIIVLSVFYILFFIAWGVFRINILPSIKSLFDEDTTIYVLSEAFSKFLVWTLPVIIILKLQSHSFSSYTKLNSNFFKGIISGFAIGITLLIILFIRAKLINHDFFSISDVNINLSLNTIINTVILAGILEEITFRGFIYTKIRYMTPFWPACIITSILFSMIHIPLAFYQNMLSFQYLFTLAVISVGITYIYEETNSLATAMLVHSFWNLGVSMFASIR